MEPPHCQPITSLWVAMHIDHDGNTSQPSQTGHILESLAGLAINLVSMSNAVDPVTFKLFSNGNFKWKKTAPLKHGLTVTSTTTERGPSQTGVIPTGWSVYLAFAAKDATTRTLPNHALNVTEANCDTAGFTRTPATATVSEAGTTGTFTVVLDSQPSGNVVIDLSASDTGEATVDKSTLTFTAGDWDSAQTVTVTGVDDNLDDGDQSSTVTLAVNAGSTADNSYDALANQTVSVTTVDDDGPGAQFRVQQRQFLKRELQQRSQSCWIHNPHLMWLYQSLL